MLAAFVSKKVADDLNYVTERDIPEYEMRNGGLMMSCRREPRSGVDAILGDIAPSIEGDISISDLCATLGGGRVAFRPIIRAIFYGTLDCVTEGLIDPNSIVRYSGSIKPDLDADGPIVAWNGVRIDGTPPKPVKSKPGQKRHSYRKA